MLSLCLTTKLTPLLSQTVAEVTGGRAQAVAYVPQGLALGKLAEQH